MWRNTDPRWDFDGCRNIVIYDSVSGFASHGYVETKHGYSVWVSCGGEAGEDILSTMSWPTRYWWCLPPKVP